MRDVKTKLPIRRIDAGILLPALVAQIGVLTDQLKFQREEKLELQTKLTRLAKVKMAKFAGLIFLCAFLGCLAAVVLLYWLTVIHGV